MALINGSVPVTGFIAPTDDRDDFAVTKEEYHQGGYRTVETLDEMNNIPLPRRKEGMLVNCLEDGKCYKLENNNFVEFSFGGSDVDLGDYYTKNETYSKEESYSKEEVYNKKETYNKDEVYDKGNTYNKQEVYNKNEIDSKLTEQNNKLSSKVNSSDLPNFDNFLTRAKADEVFINNNELTSALNTVKAEIGNNVKEPDGVTIKVNDQNKLTATPYRGDDESIVVTDNVIKIKPELLEKIKTINTESATTTETIDQTLFTKKGEAETITGNWVFDNPIVNNTTPTQGTHLVNKSFVEQTINAKIEELNIPAEVDMSQFIDENKYNEKKAALLENIKNDFVSKSTDSTVTANITFNTPPLANRDPLTNKEVVTKGYVDSKFVTKEQLGSTRSYKGLLESKAELNALTDMVAGDQYNVKVKNPDGTLKDTFLYMYNGTKWERIGGYDENIDLSNVVTTTGDHTITGNIVFDHLPRSDALPTEANHLINKMFFDLNSGGVVAINPETKFPSFTYEKYRDLASTSSGLKPNNLYFIEGPPIIVPTALGKSHLAVNEETGLPSFPMEKYQDMIATQTLDTTQLYHIEGPAIIVPEVINSAKKQIYTDPLTGNASVTKERYEDLIATGDLDPTQVIFIEGPNIIMPKIVSKNPLAVNETTGKPSFTMEEIQQLIDGEVLDPTLAYFIMEESAPVLQSLQNTQIATTLEDDKPIHTMEQYQTLVDSRSVNPKQAYLIEEETAPKTTNTREEYENAMPILRNKLDPLNPKWSFTFEQWDRFKRENPDILTTLDKLIIIV